MSFPQLEDLLCSAFESHVSPGVAVSIINSKNVDNIVIGKVGYEKNDQIVTENTIYDIASITKFLTAILIVQLIESGKISLETRLEEILLKTKNEPTAKLTIKKLLTSLPNFYYSLSSAKDKSAQEILQQVVSADWEEQTDKQITFTNTAYILLGMVVEELRGKNLHLVASEQIFAPLNMIDTNWGESIDLSRTAPSEIDEWRGREIEGEIHDESAWKIYSQLGQTVGSAGVFSTLADMRKLLISFLNDQRLLKFSSKKMMIENHLSDIDMQSGLGLEMDKDWLGNNKASLIGKTGFTGTMIVFDKKLEKGLVMLTNATYPHRPVDRSAINNLRKEVCDYLSSS